MEVPGAIRPPASSDLNAVPAVDIKAEATFFFSHRSRPGLARAKQMRKAGLQGWWTLGQKKLERKVAPAEKGLASRVTAL